MRILVTGTAGFIGAETAIALARQGHSVAGLDNLNDYYDVRLKQARWERVAGEGVAQHRIDIADAAALQALFGDFRPERVVHLAAQPGVRYSITHPEAYIQSNLVGFGNLLEACRRHHVGHLVYASSSSVYGGNRKLPFAESDPVDHPVSLYAATKKSNELMAHSYSHLYGLPVTGLRFFTVYGPWGRPDMAVWLFSAAMLEGRAIALFNRGEMRRDFTYVDDIVGGVLRALEAVPVPDPHFDALHPDPGGSWAPYRVFNIGNHQPVALREFVATLEGALGVRAIIDEQPMQPGDVEATYADVDRLRAVTGFAPATPLAEGLARWAEWYRGWRATAG
ncbi:MAG: NAD-dependent epimerase [Rhodocyclaceae bacterium]|nr:NAD-dependent epimerase [Rhodocyclaceae bacterium]